LNLVTLKKRTEFLRVRGGARWATPGFVLEAKRRPGDDPAAAIPRFGFTVTKKLGNAVIRNRIRRRLKSLIRNLDETRADPAFDYVIIARAEGVRREFSQLACDLHTALDRVHRTRNGSRAARNA
jgi:ribonuclease P protein component